MTKTTVTKLLTAAATVATSAFFASTVAIETAKAATFTLTPGSDLAGQFDEKWELDAPNAESVEDLFERIGRDETASWGVKWGGVELELSLVVAGLRLWEMEDGPGIMIGSLGGVEIFWPAEAASGETVWVGRDTTPSNWTVVAAAAAVPEPSGAIALGVLGAGLVASRLRRRSK